MSAFLFDPEKQVDWNKYFLIQAIQSGHGSAFEGQLYQRGSGLGNILRGVFRTILPVAKSVAKTVGRQAVSSGADLLNDLADGEDIKVAAKRRSKEAVGQLMKKGRRRIKKAIQKGKGLGNRQKVRRSGSIVIGIRKNRGGLIKKVPRKSGKTKKDIFD